MRPPIATYRLQFRNGMDFERARTIVPYLARLGLSHLYASPIFTAEPGSTHGYDVTDCNEIDPDLGGLKGFEQLCAELEAHGLGIILDIVPNHMAASLSNAWWVDVLKHGPDSRFAPHFDIDWSQRLTLPVLGRPWVEILDAGEVRLVRDKVSGSWSLAYFEQRFPLAPSTMSLLPNQGVHELSDRDLIDQVHRLQNWELTFWKDARKRLTYRRFFEVTGLVGMRVEERETFEATHRLIFDLVDRGLIDGLRIDHIDGLADPTDYLKRLRRRIGVDSYLVVEKIVEGEEQLPPDWPVEGTTGYEFITAMAATLADPDGAQVLADELAAIEGKIFDVDAEVRAAKEQMMLVNFEGEMDRLVSLAGLNADLHEERLRTAIREVLVAFPVYRTYADRGGISKADTSLLEAVRRGAARHADPQAVDAIVALIATRGGSEFQTRFQQLSGPIMAKAIEDTLFYRDRRMLAVNEVGGHPDDGLSASPQRAHQRLADLVATQGRGLRATATHDTKRGEDARARLYALSEMAGEWAAFARRWMIPEVGAPDAATQWMICQALLGIWPAGPKLDGEKLAALEERFLPYLEKALREAKRETSWTEPNEGFEKHVAQFASRLLHPENAVFQNEFSAFVARLHRAGWINSLAQTAIKLTLPGVPDIYQGTETFDDSLVDPDNRRNVHFDRLIAGFSPAPVTWNDWLQADAKQRLIAALLAVRAGRETQVSYVPLELSGSAAQHGLAYATHLGGRDAIVAVPRLSAGLLDGEDRISGRAWEDTVLQAGTAIRMHDVVTGVEFHVRSLTPLAELFAHGPIAVLVAS